MNFKETKYSLYYTNYAKVLILKRNKSSSKKPQNSLYPYLKVYFQIRIIVSNLEKIDYEIPCFFDTSEIREW